MIHIKSRDEIQKMRVSGVVNAEIHAELGEAIRPGITTKELDSIASEMMEKFGVVSSFQHAMGFPGHICVSINEELGHGIPSERVIQSGDIVKVDIGVDYQGFHTDAAVTHIVGPIGLRSRYLVDVTETALLRGLQVAEPGRRVSDISHALFRTVDDAGFGMVRHAFGHGIGSALHEEPQIPNFGPAGHGARLKPGMTIAIEPVVVAGARATTKAADGWADSTFDMAASAHFEHTLLVTHDRPEILTQLNESVMHQRNHGDKPYRRLREMMPGERDGLMDLAASQMDSILMEAWGRRANPQEIFEQEDAKTMVLENHEKQIVGFMVFSCNPSALHLNTLIIDPRFHGTGVAQEAMAFLEDEAYARTKVCVELCVQTNNRRAVRFYEKLDYKEVQITLPNTMLMRKLLPVPRNR